MKDAEIETFESVMLYGRLVYIVCDAVSSIYNGGQMQQEWRGSMKIEDFLEIIKNSIIEKLGNGYQVTVCKSDKNNGVVYTGLRIQKIILLWRRSFISTSISDSIKMET